jgi:hypothetical protein
VVTTTRKTRGDDIDAACGQLAGQVFDRTQRTGRRTLLPSARPSGGLHMRRSTRPAGVSLPRCLLIGAAFLAQQATGPRGSSRLAQPTKPRDPRTRAKLHTELGALYLQANKLAVALEELTIAIDIDPRLCQGLCTRGLAGFQAREMHLPTRTFSGP